MLLSTALTICQGLASFSALKKDANRWIVFNTVRKISKAAEIILVSGSTDGKIGMPAEVVRPVEPPQGTAGLFSFTASNVPGQ